MFFPSSLDRLQVFLTTFALVIAVGVPLGLGLLFLRLGLSLWLIAPTGVLVLVALGIAYLHRPLGLKVGASGLAVRRPRGSVELAFSQLAEVHGGASWPPKSIGVFRSGGFFGTYGAFWAPSWGRFRAWTTRSKPLVELVFRDGQHALVSVDDEAAFLAAVRDAVARRGGGTIEVTDGKARG